jgi:DNA polymerase-3 subunit beta
MTATMTKTQVQLDRKSLVAALNRVGGAIPTRTNKPILECVHLYASDDVLHLSATDLDVSITTTLGCYGELPDCVVRFRDLLGRVKSSKAASCSLCFDEDRSALVVNGGRVEHIVNTRDVAQYPPIASEPSGHTITIPAGSLRSALKTCVGAAAKENTRYAINGVLLESGTLGTRLVATDGRRMAVVELEHVETVFRGSVILTRQMITLTRQLTDAKNDAFITFHIAQQSKHNDDRQPARITITGSGWTLAGTAHEGTFPNYRDVLPKPGKRFVVDRDQLLATLSEVGLATDLDRNGVVFEMTREQITMSAQSAGNGSASGAVPVLTTNATSRKIRTGFDPRLLGDAIKSLKCARVVCDMQPNRRSKLDGSIIQQPGMFHAEDSPQIRWVVMPVTIDSSRKR